MAQDLGRVADKSAAMSQRPVPLLGRIALHLKLINMDQLAAATHQQGTRGGNLGAILVEQGALSEPQLQQVLRARQQIVAKHRASQAAEQAAPEMEHGENTAAVSGPEVTAEPSTQPTQAAPDAQVVARALSPRPPATASASPQNAEELISLLRMGVEKGASDIHIHSGTPLRLRLHGSFEQINDTPMEKDATEALILSALTDEQRTTFLERGELDFAYEVPGLGRFRANIFRQQRGTDGVFRHIPVAPPSLEELGLPSGLAKFTNYHQGLVLITGPANCGKSSTLAAMVDIINTERLEHILTIEDPVEYVHPSKRCVVNQRNVGAHTESFARALRGALREDPDVIVIGELRDLETVSLALTAAETGHLVLGTLHTNSTIRTVNRLVGVFPAEQQDQIRNMVSESLRAVVSQRLVRHADGQGRAPALEILVNNRAIGNLIRENKTFQIGSMLQTGVSQGMCLLDQSLSALVESGKVTREEAIKHCEDPRKIPGG